MLERFRLRSLSAKASANRADGMEGSSRAMRTENLNWQDTRLVRVEGGQRVGLVEWPSPRVLPVWRSFVFMDLFRPTSFLVFLCFITQRTVLINKKGACFLWLLMFPIRLFFSIYQAKMPQKLCRKFNFSCEKLSCSRVHDTANPSELKKNPARKQGQSNREVRR